MANKYPLSLYGATLKELQPLDILTVPELIASGKITSNLAGSDTVSGATGNIVAANAAGNKAVAMQLNAAETQLDFWGYLGTGWGKKFSILDTGVSVPGNLTLSGGTANGVPYLNGSKVLTTGTGLVFDGTNLSTTGGFTANNTITCSTTNPISLLIETDQATNSQRWGIQSETSLFKIRAFNDAMSSAVDLLIGTRTGEILLGQTSSTGEKLQVTGNVKTLGVSTIGYGTLSGATFGANQVCRVDSASNVGYAVGVPSAGGIVGGYYVAAGTNTYDGGLEYQGTSRVLSLRAAGVNSVAVSSTGVLVSGDLSAAQSVNGDKVLGYVQNTSTSASASAQWRVRSDTGFISTTVTPSTANVAYLTGGPTTQSAYIWTGSNIPISIGINAVEVGRFTSTGLSVAGKIVSTAQNSFEFGSTAKWYGFNGVSDTYLSNAASGAGNGIFTTAASTGFMLNGTGAATVTASGLSTSFARAASLTSASFATSGTGVVGDINKLSLIVRNTLGGNTGGAGIGALLEASASNQTGLVFYCDGGSGTQTENARLTSGGSLLLGQTSSTGERLQVTGNVKVTGTGSFAGLLSAAGDSPEIKIGRSSGNQPKLSFGSSASTDFYIQADSATGIIRYDAGPSAAWGGKHVLYVDQSEVGRFTSTGLSVTGALSAVQSGVTHAFGADSNYGWMRAGGTSLGLLIGTSDTKPVNFVIGNVIKATLDASGNLGLGVTPSAWSSSYQALQIGGPFAALFASRSSGGSYAGLASNAYLNSSTVWTYANSSQPATRYDQYNGGHQWYTATSGTAGNPISFTQAMTIDSSGNLLIGGTTTGTRLVVTGNAASDVSTFVSPSGGSGTKLAKFSVGAGLGTEVGSISYNGSTGVLYNTSSDYRLKNIAGNLDGVEAVAYINSLRPVQGSWKADGSRFIGLIAHEAQEVSQTQVATGVKDGEEMQSMDYSNPELIANLIAAVQYLSKQIGA